MAQWIGVDLDGTLARHLCGVYHHAQIGDPVPRMVSRVRGWLAAGIEVRVVTARMASIEPAAFRRETEDAIREWTLRHVGCSLPATAEKDYEMVELWDDRAVQVARDKGTTLEEMLRGNGKERRP